MALSGSLNTNSYEGRYIRISWTATQDIPNNRSTISYTISAVGGNSSWYYTGPVTVVINGTTVYNQTSRPKQYAGSLKSGTLTINHNNDGTKSFSASIRAAIYSASVNCTGSTTFTLNDIPRYPSAPTSIEITSELTGTAYAQEEVSLSWSGATGNITSYEIEREIDGGGWESITTSTDANENVSVGEPNEAVRFRVRAMNGTLPSNWLESDSLTITGKIFVKTDGEWRKGTAKVKADGEWKSAKRVWVKANGAWRYS